MFLVSHTSCTLWTVSHNLSQNIVIKVLMYRTVSSNVPNISTYYHSRPSKMEATWCKPQFSQHKAQSRQTYKKNFKPIPISQSGRSMNSQ